MDKDYTHGHHGLRRKENEMAGMDCTLVSWLNVHIPRAVKREGLLHEDAFEGRNIAFG